MPRTDPRNRSRYWRDPQVPGLSCLVADFTTHEYAPHVHEAFVVAVTEVGGSEFKSRGRTQEATETVLLVFNPDEPHSGRMARSSRWCYRGLYLAGPAIDAVKTAVGLGETPYFTDNVFRDRDLIDAFLALHRALDDGRDALEQSELLVASFGQLACRHAASQGRVELPASDRRKIRAVQDIMQDRYHEELRLEDMGEGIGLNPFQLIGLFKRGTGLTPHAYLTQLRLKVAIAAMKTGVSLAEAAVSAGFYDQAALSKHFKRSYGITPLQWVTAVRN
ncbi:AraC family transcriptional regulator [Microbaculum marinum]|uniref:AraC family transcriptional regulator n=1 Tax=Microbaculum marinum TaxID=1764581 RepID=A0AAW9RQB6_9HYPH